MKSQQLEMFNFEVPSMPDLNLLRCVVRQINHETAVKMVQTYHYAHRVPSIVVAFGMYVDQTLAGCITYGISSSRNAMAPAGEKYIPNTLELNRLFIFDWCGRNSESWLIGQTFKLLKNDYPDYFILVSYADAAVGHCGYIYQATNWTYTGKTKIDNIGYIIEGKFVHRRSCNRLYGSSSEKVIKNLFPDAERIIDKGKHRYVYFLGNKRLRRELKRALKWSVVSTYPKGKENNHATI